MHDIVASSKKGLKLTIERLFCTEEQFLPVNDAKWF